MFRKSFTENFSPYEQKEGDLDIEEEEEKEIEISNRPIKKKKTKKSVYYANPEPEQSELKLKLNINQDESLNEIKNRNNSSAIAPHIDLTLFDDLEGNNENFNIKQYLRRRYAVSKRKNYFAPENKHEKTMEKFSDITENEIFFNGLNFVLFMVYHFLFHFLFGPFSAILTYHFTGFSIYRNLFFWGLYPLSFFNYALYLIYLMVIVTYFATLDSYNINIFIIVMIWPVTFLRICIISIKYATMSQKKINILKSRKLEADELLEEFTFLNWAWEKDICIERELYATIERTELDLAMFKFSFLSDVDANIRKDLENSIKNQSKKSTSTSNQKGEKKKSKIDILESKILSYEHMLQNYNDSDLSGYCLAKLILKNIREKNQKIFKRTLQIVAVISILRSLFPIVYEVASKETHYNGLDIFILIFATLLNLIYFTANYFFLIFGVFELDKTYRILSQLSNLLSPKPIEQYHTAKTLPTINFFCPVSLKCWDSLHNLLRNYGAKFRLRVNYYLSLFLIYITILLILILLSVFEVIEISDRLLLLMFFSDFVVILVTLMFIFFKALAINDHYHIHIYLIKKNKNVLCDLLNLYGVYFEKEDFVPDNEIYKEGVFRIKSNVSSLLNYELRVKGRKNTLFKTYNQQKEEIIKKSITNLINISDNIIQDLQFCAKYMPFKVLGISVNKQFIESVFAAIGSILIIIIQKLLRDKNLL